MKKKLEAELISIAHRILKINNRETVAQLQQEALNLYQKLSILRFYEEHFEPAQPTIGRAELEMAIENSKTNDGTDFHENQSSRNIETEEKTAEIEKLVDDIFIGITSENTESEAVFLKDTEVNSDMIEIVTNLENSITEKFLLTEPLIDVIETPSDKDIVGIFESDSTPEKIENTNLIETEIHVLEIEEEEEKIIEFNQEAQNDVANPLFNEEQPTLIEQLKPKHEEQTLFSEPLFTENKESSETEKTSNSIQISFESLFGQNYKDIEFVKADEDTADFTEKTKTKRENKKTRQVEDSENLDLFGAKAVAELYTNTITLGLNDRIAFQMHLFNNSDQDLNRVISQLNTMNNIDEALDFINNMVKPDYNNWQDKDEYAERFMALVEKRFS